MLVQPSETQWLAIAGAIGNRQAAIPPQRLFVREAIRRLNEGIEDMGAHRTNAGDLGKLRDLRIAAPTGHALSWPETAGRDRARCPTALYHTKAVRFS